MPDPMGYLLSEFAKAYPDPYERSQAIKELAGSTPGLLEAADREGMLTEHLPISGLGSFVGGIEKSLADVPGMVPGFVDLASKPLAAAGVLDRPTTYKQQYAEAVDDILYDDREVNAVGETLGELLGFLIPAGVASKMTKAITAGTALESLAKSRPILSLIGLEAGPSLNLAKAAQLGIESTLLESAISEDPSWKGVAGFFLLDSLLRSRQARAIADKIMPKQLAERGVLSDLWDTAKMGWKREADITGLEPKLAQMIMAISEGAEMAPSEVAELLVGNPLQLIFRGSKDVSQKIVVTSRLGEWTALTPEGPVKIIDSPAAEHATITFGNGASVTVKDKKSAFEAARHILNGERIESVLTSKKGWERFTETYIAQHPSQLRNLNEVKKYSEVIKTAEAAGGEAVESELYKKAKALEEQKKPYIVVEKDGKAQIIDLSGPAKGMGKRKYYPSTQLQNLAGDIRDGKAEIIGLGEALEENEIRKLENFIWGEKRFSGEETGRFYVFNTSKPFARLRIFQGEGQPARIVDTVLDHTEPGIWKLRPEVLADIANGSAELVEVGLKDAEDNFSRAAIMRQISGAKKSKEALEVMEGLKKAAAAKAAEKEAEAGKKGGEAGGKAAEKEVGKEAGGEEKVAGEAGKEAGKEAEKETPLTEEEIEKLKDQTAKVVETGTEPLTNAAAPIEMEVAPLDEAPSVYRFNYEPYLEDFIKAKEDAGWTARKVSAARKNIPIIFQKIIMQEPLTTAEDRLLREFFAEPIMAELRPGIQAGDTAAQKKAGIIMRLLTAGPKKIPYGELPVYLEMISMLPDELFKSEGFEDLMVKFSNVRASMAVDKILQNADATERLQFIMRLSRHGSPAQTVGHELGHMIWAFLPENLRNDFIKWVESPEGIKLFGDKGEAATANEIFVDMFGDVFAKRAREKVKLRYNNVIEIEKAMPQRLKGFLKEFISNVRNTLTKLWSKRAVEEGAPPFNIEAVADDIFSGKAIRPTGFQKGQFVKIWERSGRPISGPIRYSNPLPKQAAKELENYLKDSGLDVTVSMKRDFFKQKDISYGDVVSFEIKASSEEDLKKAQKKVNELLIELFELTSSKDTPGAWEASFGPDGKVSLVFDDQAMTLSFKGYGNPYTLAYATVDKAALSIQMNMPSSTYLRHVASLTRAWNSIIYEGFLRETSGNRVAVRKFSEIYSMLESKEVQRFVQRAFWRLFGQTGIDGSVFANSKAVWNKETKKLVIYLPEKAWKLLEDSGQNTEDLIYGLNPKTVDSLFSAGTANRVSRTIVEKWGKKNRSLLIRLGRKKFMRNFVYKVKGFKKPFLIRNLADNVVEFVNADWNTGLKKQLLQELNVRDYNDLQLIFSKLGKAKNFSRIEIIDASVPDGKAMWFLKGTEDIADHGMDKVVVTTSFLNNRGQIPQEIRDLMQKGYKVRLLVRGGNPRKAEAEYKLLRKVLSRHETEFAKKASEAGISEKPIQTINELAEKAGYRVAPSEEGENLYDLIPQEGTGFNEVKGMTLTEAEDFFKNLGDLDLLTQEVETIGAMPSHQAESTVNTVLEPAMKEVEETPVGQNSYRDNRVPSFSTIGKAATKGTVKSVKGFVKLMDRWFMKYGAPTRAAMEWIEEMTDGTIPLFTKYYQPISQGLHQVGEDVITLLEPILPTLREIEGEDENMIRLLMTYGFGMDKALMTEREQLALSEILKKYNFTAKQKEIAETLTTFFEDAWNYGNFEQKSIPYVEQYHPFRWARMQQEIAEAGEETIDQMEDRAMKYGYGVPSSFKERTGRNLYLNSEKKISELVFAYTTGVAKEKNVGDVLNDLGKEIFRLETKSDRTILEDTNLYIMRQYRNGVTHGRGPAGAYFSAALADAFYKNITGQRFDDEVITVINKLTYMNLIGMNAPTVARNFTQPFLTLFPMVSAKNFHEGSKMAVKLLKDQNHPLWQVLKPYQRALLAKGTKEEVQKIVEEFALEGKGLSTFEKLYRTSLKPMRYSEVWNRLWSFSAGYLEAEDILARIKNGEKIAKVISDSPLATFAGPTRSQLLDMLQSTLEGGVSAEVFKVRLGTEIVNGTQWFYSTGEGAVGAQSRYGRLFFTFSTWASNYVNWIRRNIFAAGLDPTLSKGLTPYGRKFLARTAAVHGGLFGLYQMLGINPNTTVTQVFPSYTGGPAFQLMMDIIQTKGHGYTSDEAKARVFRDVQAMVQPMYSMDRTIKHMIEYGYEEEYGKMLKSLIGTVQKEKEPEWTYEGN